MKPPSKKIWAALIAAVIVVAVISVVTGRNVNEAQQRADSNVVFVNESGAAIGSVGYSFARYDGTSESGAACNADGSLLKRGDKLWLDVRFPCTLTVYADVEGREPLASLVMEQEPPSGEQGRVWYVIARDGDSGITLTLSLNRDGKALDGIKSPLFKNLSMDVPDCEIRYGWYPGRSIQGDGEEFVVMSFSQAAGEELVQTLSGAVIWQYGPFPQELKEKAFVSVYSQESLINWEELPHKGWYYFLDFGGGTGSYRTADYIAAVYTPESRTLYFFEWHQ